MNEIETPEIEKEIGKKMKKTDGKLIKLKLKNIKPYKGNAKLHPENQVAKIRDSIINFGYKDLIAVDENNIVLEGHGRLRALYQIDITGEKEINVWQISDFTESEKKAYRIAHNKIGADTGFDVDILKEEFYELEGTDNFNDTGFETSEITELWDQDKEIIEDKVDVNAYERAKNKTKIQLGDIYLLGNHRLMCGDSTEVDYVNKLMDGEKADMVFTDPPYGVSIGGGRSQTVEKKGIRKIKNDELRGDELISFLTDSLINMNLKKNGSFYICYDQKTQVEFITSIKKCGMTFKRTIVWNKNVFGLSGKKGYRPKYELIAFGYNGEDYIWNGNNSQSDVWDIARPTERIGNHPTPKPIEICSRAINNSSIKQDLILDLFGGSGSTLISCEQLERRCFMAELDPVYCQVIIDRWEKFTNKQAIKE